MKSQMDKNDKEYFSLSFFCKKREHFFAKTIDIRKIKQQNIYEQTFGGNNMISTLHIKNIGIIDDLSIDFNEGLNILTGETGAGNINNTISRNNFWWKIFKRNNKKR